MTKQLKYTYLIIFVLFASIKAMAGPTLSAPSTTTNYSFILTPNYPSAPYFLTEYQQRKSNGAWEYLTTNYSSASVRVEVEESGVYQYRTRWLNPSTSPYQYSNWGNTVTVNVTIYGPPRAPTTYLSSNNSTGDFILSWDAINEANDYTFQEKVGSLGRWNSGTSTRSTRYYFYNKPENTYHYRVKACNSYGCSGWSSVKSTNVRYNAPPTPGFITILPPPTGVVYWGASDGAASYQLDQKVNGNWVRYANTPGRGTTFGGPASFRVRACDPALNCSAWRY